MLEQQQLRLLYLSPETLLSAPVWERLSAQLKINGFIVDEVHCPSTVGETFRPAYRRLGAVRPALKTKPTGTQIAIAAFTATADSAQAQIIQQVLQLKQPVVFRQNPYRQNLHLKVQTIWTPRGRRQQCRLSGVGQAESTCVADGTARAAQWLSQMGHATTAGYHAGLCPDERHQAVKPAGSECDYCCLHVCFWHVQTRCALGGHFHAPLLLSEYVQEIGQSGTGWQASIALTLIIA